jgi:hypothetical protein
VVEGQALPVNVWLIHSNNKLREKLEPVMQGAVWKKWETKYDEIPEGKEKGKVEQAAQAISRYLTTTRETKVSIKGLRQAVPECAKLPPTTFTRAVDKALELAQIWQRRGHDLVHAGSHFEVTIGL